jgi:hypothetical protein
VNAVVKGLIEPLITAIGKALVDLRDGHMRTGQVIDLAEQWTQEASQRLARCLAR